MVNNRRIYNTSNHSDVRKLKIESLLQSKLSEIFLFLSFDKPLFKRISITRVLLSDTKSYAFIYVVPNGTITDFDKFLKNFDNYMGLIRKKISDSIELRHYPRFSLRVDTVFMEQERVNMLIDQLKEEGKI